MTPWYYMNYQKNGNEKITHFQISYQKIWERKEKQINLLLPFFFFLSLSLSRLVSLFFSLIPLHNGSLLFPFCHPKKNPFPFFSLAIYSQRWRVKDRLPVGRTWAGSAHAVGVWKLFWLLHGRAGIDEQ